ncbi:hypothetical protein BDW22DRAFT_531956 [Trametopsis cervina]|nr:hypothetical protein BDW22DRAFT_531956 [Trametopsis cervina]
MGKKSKLNKGGKMYDDDPGCKYMVIENPWPKCEASRRTDRWFQHVGAWLWYASDKTVLPEEIYYVKTKDELVASYAKDADITPLLGQHDWRQFTLKEPVDPKGCWSYMFEFDYGTKGHPADHQWASYALPDLTKDVHLQRGALPIRQPYPRPVWANSRDGLRSCRDLALPMPEVKAQPPVPSPAAPVEPPSDRTSIYAGLAERIPERPPAAETPAGDSAGPIPGQAQPGKLDPDAAESAALRALKREPADERLLNVKREPGLVKPEPGEPSADMQAEFERWRREQEAQRASVKQEPGSQDPRVKSEPGLVKAEDTSGEPSEEMRQLYAQYERSRSTTMATPMPASAQGRSSVKPEPLDNTPLPGADRSRQVKREAIEQSEQVDGRTMDPRRRNNPAAGTSSNENRPVKREFNEDSSGYTKRVKTE